MLPHELPSNSRHRKLCRKNYDYLKIISGQNLVPNVPSRNEVLALVVKNYAKPCIQVYWSCLGLFNIL